MSEYWQAQLHGIVSLAKTAQNNWEEDTINLVSFVTFADLSKCAARPCNLKNPNLFPDWLYQK